MAYFDDFLRFITVTGSIPLLVEWGDIIRPVVSILAQAWSIRYIYYWNLQFLNNAIIIKTKVLLPQAEVNLGLAKFGYLV